MTDAYSSQPQQPVPGLLSDPTNGAPSPASQGLMSLGAGLIRAGGPSPYKNSFGGVGDAVLGGLDSYNRATTQQLNAQFIRGQINKQQFDQLTGLAQTIGALHWSNSPIPPALQKLADQYGLTPPAPGTPGGPSPAQGNQAVIRRAILTP
jgi:hypothetical protein